MKKYVNKQALNIEKIQKVKIIHNDGLYQGFWTFFISIPPAYPYNFFQYPQAIICLICIPPILNLHIYMLYFAHPGIFCVPPGTFGVPPGAQVPQVEKPWYWEFICLNWFTVNLPTKKCSQLHKTRCSDNLLVKFCFFTKLFFCSHKVEINFILWFEFEISWGCV